jgi:hypothetical protein
MSTNISKRVQVLYVDVRKSKAGNNYQVAQCVVYDKEGIPKVGELWSFNKDLTIVAGEFVADFEISVDMDRKVSAQLVGMYPVTKTGVVLPQSPASVSPAASPAKL